MAQHSSTEVNARYTPDGARESLFRQQVRDIVDLNWSAHNAQILDELKRLKAVAAIASKVPPR